MSRVCSPSESATGTGMTSNSSRPAARSSLRRAAMAASSPDTTRLSMSASGIIPSGATGKPASATILPEKGRRRAPTLCCPCLQGRQRLFEQVQDGTHPGDGAVSKLSRQVKSPLAQGRDQDGSAWYARQLSFDLVEATVVIDLALPKGRAQHDDIFAQVLHRGCHGETIGPLNVWKMARPDPQPQPMGSKVAQCPGLLRKDQGMTRIGGDK